MNRCIQVHSGPSQYMQNVMTARRVRPSYRARRLLTFVYLQQ